MFCMMMSPLLPSEGPFPPTRPGQRRRKTLATGAQQRLAPKARSGAGRRVAPTRSGAAGVVGGARAALGARIVGGMNPLERPTGGSCGIALSPASPKTGRHSSGATLGARSPRGAAQKGKPDGPKGSRCAGWWDLPTAWHGKRICSEGNAVRSISCVGTLTPPDCRCDHWQDGTAFAESRGCQLPGRPDRQWTSGKL
jgi:hypothetical protein